MFPRTNLHLAAGLVATASFVTAGPCDIYKSGNTPCVAAHGTTRALYSAYTGALYQVTRGSDGAKSDIRPLSAGGVANATAQDSFCRGTTCEISIIYDQSENKNHLTRAPPGGAADGPQPGGFDNLASAIGAPVTLNGQKAYGVFISPRTGYRNNAAKKIATLDAPEGMYAVLDGTHWNDACCFDYGNAETNNLDTGNGHMETIYFGTSQTLGSGSGPGPWIMADLENGLFSGVNPTQNVGDPTIKFRFVNAIVKGRANQFAIRGGDAQSGPMSTFYSGRRPNKDGYNPMSKEGAIILGIGGDNSNGAQGTFYEGVMTSGYPSDDTENQVQANVVAAKYAVTSLVSGPAVKVGSSISFRVTTPGYDTRYITHSGNKVSTQVVTSSSSTALKQQASWNVRTGLANSGCVSFESKDTPGSFIRQSNFILEVQDNDDSKDFTEDATFCPKDGLNGKGNSIISWRYPTRYIRHFNSGAYASTNGGPEDFDNKNFFNDDVSFVLGNSLA